MRARLLLLALVLLTLLSLAPARDQRAKFRGKARRRGGGARIGRNGMLRHRHRNGTTRADGLVLNDGRAIFIESYKPMQELEYSYNIIPGKKGLCIYRGISMFDGAVWSPKPCVTCLCSGGEVVCDEVTCPRLLCFNTLIPLGECCPVCTNLVPDVPEISGDLPVPNDPGEHGPRSRVEIEELLRKEEEEHREEEERLQKKDEERKRKRKERKRLEAERQKQLEEEEKRKLEEEQERLKEEDERRKEEDERRKEEEQRRREIEARRREEETKKQLNSETEMERIRQEEEEEEEVWLRGDVFRMLPPSPAEEEIRPLPGPEEEEEEEDEMDIAARAGIGPKAMAPLPVGCVFSDDTVTCENAQLTSIPPISIPELKVLSLEGNAISAIPAEAFNGIPNLERINLGKNKLTSSGIHPQAFRILKQLTRLYMDGNLLDQIPAELPPSLQELKINENNLRGVDESSLQDLSNLIILELEGNMLSEGNVDPLAFSALTQLSYLRLGRNYFRTIPQGLPETLQELHLENNVIEEISETAFNRTSHLNVIVLRHNRLDETRIAPLAWINHRNLESVDLSYNHLYHVPSFLPRALVHLVLVGNQIERIPGYVFAHMNPGLEYLYLSYNKLDDDGIDSVSFFGAFHSLRELFLDHNLLTAVPLGISEMRSINFLRLNDNKIRSLSEESICDPLNEDDSSLVTLRLENNFIDPRKISPTAFSCVFSYSSVVLKPQKVK